MLCVSVLRRLSDQLLAINAQPSARKLSASPTAANKIKYEVTMSFFAVISDCGVRCCSEIADWCVLAVRKKGDEFLDPVLPEVVGRCGHGMGRSRELDVYYSREVVGIHVLLTRSLFGDGICRAVSNSP